MYPGLSDADCQVAGFRYSQLLNEGQRQQISAAARPVIGGRRLVSGSVCRHVGALLICAGQRLQGGQAVRSERLVSTATGEMGAVA